MQPTKAPSGPIQRVLTPYDTGKVKIGLLYDARQPWSPSRDSYNLQTALIGHPAVRASFTDRLVSFFRSFA